MMGNMRTFVTDGQTDGAGSIKTHASPYKPNLPRKMHRWMNFIDLDLKVKKSHFWLF